jgi:hypothetical protein
MRIGQYTIKGRLVQQPNENLRRLIDYTRWMEVGEYITDVVVLVDPTTTPPFQITNIVIDPEGQKIAYYASGGVDGEDYTATFRVTTSVNQTREDEILFGVREIVSG